MSKMSHTSKDHSNTMFVSSINRVLIADGTTRLNNSFYSRSLRQWTSSHDLVLQLKAYTPVLDEAWEVLQAALTAFRKHDDQKFFEIIDELKEELLPRKTSA